MFLSKIWFVLVGLLAGVAVTAAFVAPRPADRRIEQLEGQRLDRAQYAAEQMLKTDAHRWIDYVAKLGRDALVAEALDSASRGAGEAKVLSETVSDRLRTLIPNLRGIGLVTVAAVDAKGRVIARLGDGDGEAGESIAGAEVVADALRGVLTDDVWGSGGKILRIAAAPVLAKTRDRIVGVVYVGAESGRRLADLWKKNLGVDVVLLLRGHVLTATVSEALVARLPGMIEQRRNEIAEAKRTRALSLPMGSDRLLAVAAPFTGQAAEQDAYYALMTKKAPASDPLALLSSTAADDLKWGSFPWLPLGGGVVLILAVGLFLQRHEMEGPLSRLRRDLQRLSRGELQKIEDAKYPGKFGGIARDVNAAMERYMLSPSASRSDIGKRDLNAVLDGDLGSGIGLGPRPTPGSFPPPGAVPSPFPVPPAPSPFAPSAQPASPFAFTAPRSAPPAFAAPAPSALPSPAFALPPALGSTPAPASALGATPQARLSSPPLTPQAPAQSLFSAPSASQPPVNVFTPPAAPMAALATPPARPAPPSPSPAARLSPLGAPGAPMPAPRVTGSIPIEAGTPEDAQPGIPGEVSDPRTRATDAITAEEAHIREVFADYMATRQRTGETAGTITLDKFRSKLEANKQQLVAKYGCRTARFSVYVKEGKAAIRAIPVKE